MVIVTIIVLLITIDSHNEFLMDTLEFNNYASLLMFLVQEVFHMQIALQRRNLKEFCASSGCLKRRPGQWPISSDLASGKQPHNYGKSPFLMGKCIISIAMFNSYVKLPESNMILPNMEIHWK